MAQRDQQAALAALRAGDTERAVTIARAEAQVASEFGQAHAILAHALVSAGAADEARSIVNDPRALSIGEAHVCDALGSAADGAGEHQVANRLYRRAVELAPNDARCWHNLATSERSFGRLPEAEAALDRTLHLDPGFFPAYTLRSELRVQTDAHNHVDELRLRLEAGTSDAGRLFLAYALAKELDDLGEYDKALLYFNMGANARRQALDYNVAVDISKLARIADVFDRESFSTIAPSDTGRRFTFIIGLPRSGTTLVERIIASHAGVRSNGETDNFSRALLAASPVAGVDIFARARAATPATVASNYESIAGAGASGKLIVEKLPMNYLYVGPIHLALPAAPILLLRRSPVEACFAMYRTLFGAAYPFSYSFEDLARYYAAYTRLIAHWESALPGRMRTVDYEQLVNQPEAVAAEIVEHCGLSWDPGSLDLSRQEGVSRTASAAQVRRPIYTSSIDRWRRYGRGLDPLADALQRAGVEL